jgi:hypothetical protein
VAILVKGKIRQIGTVSEVRRWGIQERRFRLEVAAWPERVAGPFQVIANDAIDGHRRVDIVLATDAILDDVLRALHGAGVVVHGCDRVEPDLEEAFARLLSANAAEGEA